ncbi:TD and POZ domain-containing protein 5 [Araneus ventricosus]|uniref:TD and POZ domain-containing protein 5 n=1 Tax=Araneus ventricosus TaxID=182803 RepID=A0A4Y2D7K8_ARAVE|nr:TD and POZ domain-containing protein 5 [Araneus ventricosus]
MASKESEGKCFTILWKLENISYCLEKKGDRIESPAFVVEAVDQTKWKLLLYPRGGRVENCIGYFLNREADSKGADKVEIKYELAFTAKDGSVLASKSIVKHAFSKGKGLGGDVFQKREDVFISKRSTFLQEDTLRVRCRIWKGVGKMKKDVRCTAHTRIGVEKRSFVWNVRNFSTFEMEQKYTYQIKSIDNEAPLMSVDLSLTGGLSSEEIIRFGLSLRDPTIQFSTVKLSLVDTSGNRVECNQDEFWFDSIVKNKQITFAFTKQKLLAKKSIYLPNDVLSLHWEFAFSKGVVLEEIEAVLSESVGPENEISDVQNINSEKKVPSSHAFNDDLKSLYDKQLFCDVKLKTKTKEFPAHKIILGGSSPVFNRMFSNEMKEKDGDCVDIQDLNDVTVSGMLYYMYTAHVKDLTWESASHLYVAADKYDIQSLRNICSSYLKDNLSPSNVCEVLLLSDSHVDGDLKSVAQDYLLKHIKDIVKSNEWKGLRETNAKLAAETLSLQYQ